MLEMQPIQACYYLQNVLVKARKYECQLVGRLSPKSGRRILTSVMPCTSRLRQSLTDIIRVI